MSCLVQHLVLVGFICLLAIACNGRFSPDLPAVSEAPAASVTRLIQHDLGETEIPIEPRRIVTLTDAWLLAPALDLEEKPIATTTYSAADGIPFRGVTPEQVEGIEIIGDGYQPNLERLLALKPDLILADANLHRQIYSQLSAIAPTVALDLFTKGDSFKESFRRIAQVLNKGERAEQLLEKYQSRLEQFKQAMGDRLDELQISYIAVYGGPLWALGNSDMAYEVFSDAGLKLTPIQEKMAYSGNVNFSLETLPEHDGDFLFIEKYPSEDVESILDSPLWRQLNTIQSGRYAEVLPQRWVGISTSTANFILDDLFKYLAENPMLGNT